ncbi:MAG: serine--tRNA ligase [Phycisphaeraceae bacterium]
MIDLKDLRTDPDRYRRAAAGKRIDVDIDRLLALDAELRHAMTRHQDVTAEKNRIGKQIGQLAGQLKKATGDEKATLEQQMRELQQRPGELKQEEQTLAERVAGVQRDRDELLLRVPMVPDAHVPDGASEDDNVELRRWSPDWFDPGKPFKASKGFDALSHMQLGDKLGLFDTERGVKMAGTRSYVLTREGMLLHQAVLRLAFDTMIHEHGFTPVSVPVLVRDEMMYGTGFFPGERENTYEIRESERGGGHDLYLTGTGEVGLMGFHKDEILSADELPRRYTTLSPCFRREAGAAGRDTAGLYRIHQFDKVEQVVICEADAEVSTQWHQRMVGYVEALLRKLELPHRVLQICTGDMGAAKVDQVDIESWMPSRGEAGPDGRAAGAWGETHSASKLHDYQCRRLNLRYKDAASGRNVYCHSLNNTVIASPRILIPILELYQHEDGSVTIPEALRPMLNGQERIG